MKNFSLTALLVLGALIVIPQIAQAQPGRQRPPQVVSPEVLEDGKVAFRILAPNAESVRLVSPDLGNLNENGALTKNDSGVWELVFGPVKTPGPIRYRYNIDGVTVTDPVNRETSEANATVFSMAYVPGLDFMQLADVPHGTVAEVTYFSKVLDKFRRMHVYTPPGYEKGDQSYPVFYLLHGASDSDDSWSTAGRANLILDNMIANGEAVPMIIVMPDGHVGRMDRQERGMQMQKFVKEFADDIVPTIEKNYRVKSGRENHAIAGLSMGGAQTLDIALNDLKDYGYVGVFSSGIFGLRRRGPEASNDQPTWEEQHLEVLKDPELKQGLKLLWFSTGRDDFLVETSRASVDLMKKHGFEAVYEETDGGHTWVNWRNYLRQFASQLFQDTPAEAKK
ncbi:esterase [Bremerella cremea]|uniref:Esterase n=1 Tax=Bremerella cremea TaxID=1031537 RepID=A0A368KMI5_9BACT|nr:alpha/beta hydrolase-fold protein [Bremerella cremea]RCS43912.1 esterase [Bremerella cremea]